jgi:hypothetical protein
MAKLNTKIDLYISKLSWQAEADKSKRTRMSYESEDATRLLDARRIHNHQLTDNAINAIVTKTNMNADKFNNEFLALPKGATVLLCKIMQSLLFMQPYLRNGSGLLHSFMISFGSIHAERDSSCGARLRMISPPHTPPAPLSASAGGWFYCC